MGGFDHAPLNRHNMIFQGHFSFTVNYVMRRLTIITLTTLDIMKKCDLSKGTQTLGEACFLCLPKNDRISAHTGRCIKELMINHFTPVPKIFFSFSSMIGHLAKYGGSQPA